MSLQLNDVTLTYPDGEGTVTALDRVSVDVAPGELTAVVGPSGSGKSSLLAVAATLIRPDSGRVVVGGVDTLGLRPRELTELRLDRVGIVFQQPNLISSLTVVEQLLVTEHMRGRSPHRARTSAMETLAAVGLAGKERRRPHQLSGGERQRVNIARAFMNSPAVLIVDEPTSALDQSRGAAIIDLLERLTREHEVATLLVTHDQSHLPQMDQVHHMVDGVLSPEVAVVG